MTDSVYLYWALAAYTNAISNEQIDSFNPNPKEWTGGSKNYYEGIRCSLNPSKQSSSSSFFEFANNFTLQNQPQITKLMLNDACSKTESANHGVIMRINAHIIKKNPSTPQKCVTGKECDIPNSNYTIWTYAEEIIFSKDILIANADTGIDN